VIDKKPEARPPVIDKKPEARPPVTTVSTPSAKVWRLPDSSGQVWEHHDPAWLRRWVESRNRALKPVVPAAAPTFAPSSPAANCTNGRCYRGR
jgi:hypothetical protein